jgi:toxin-antitoxin system PIN domain toxin
LILVDANLLVCAHVKDLPQQICHNMRPRANGLDARLSERPKVGLPWPSLLAFVRLVSNPRVFDRPEPVADAWVQVEAWLDAVPAWIPLPTDRHREVLTALIPAVSKAALMPDAHLAALAIEHGLLLCSADGDFARFPGLRWANPLLV